MLVDHPIQVKGPGGMLGHAVCRDLGQLFPGGVIDIADIALALKMDQLGEVEIIVGDRRDGFVIILRQVAIPVIGIIVRPRYFGGRIMEVPELPLDK